MFCCIGLVGGLAVGQSLGGPWTYIAPAAGFGIGLVADMKFMHRMHKPGNQKPSGSPAENTVESGRTAQVTNDEAPLQAPEPGKEQIPITQRP